MEEPPPFLKRSLDRGSQDWSVKSQADSDSMETDNQMDHLYRVDTDAADVLDGLRQEADGISGAEEDAETDIEW